jgi:bacterioferritin
MTNIHQTAQPASSGRAIALLNRALATELVCMYRYHRHYCAARDVYPAHACARLLEQADEEYGHAARIAMRIVAMGGVPDLRPETIIGRSFVEYPAIPADPAEVFLPALLEDDLVAEKIAADAFREMIEELRDTDPLTCRMLSELVSAEETHAAGLQALLLAPARAQA